jgi:hypothetical protein
VSVEAEGSDRRGLVKTAGLFILGAAMLWSAIVIAFVTFTVPEIAPWTALPVLLAALTGFVWWKRPTLRSNRFLRLARRLSQVALALLVLWALGLTGLIMAIGPSGIGPEN